MSILNWFKRFRKTTGKIDSERNYSETTDIYLKKMVQTADRIKNETGIYIREEMQDRDNQIQRAAGYLLPLLVYKEFDQIREQKRIKGEKINNRYIFQMAFHKIGVDHNLEYRTIQWLMTQAQEEVIEEYEREGKEVDAETAWAVIGLSRLIERKLLVIAHGVRWTPWLGQGKG